MDVKKFREFIGLKKLNEEINIEVEVPFWDDAVQRITAEMLGVEIAGISIEWSDIVEYCKKKNMILGREIPQSEDDIVLGQIRDLLFPYYGSVLFSAQSASLATFNTSKMGTKTLVFSELSSAILQKIKEGTGIVKAENPQIVLFDGESGDEGSIEDDVLENKTKKFKSGYSNITNRDEFLAKRTNESIIKEPAREHRPDNLKQVESFAHNKSKRKELINALTGIEHPKAVDLKSDVGSSFKEGDIEDELGKELYAAYEAIGDGGIIYSAFENTYWIRENGELIRII